MKPGTQPHAERKPHEVSDRGRAGEQDNTIGVDGSRGLHVTSRGERTMKLCGNIGRGRSPDGTRDKTYKVMVSFAGRLVTLVSIIVHFS